jgi:serine/threonine protein kinase
VAHRDIKLDNILLTKEGSVKLCDFGVSRITKKGDFVTDQCGTPAYLAPEIIMHNAYSAFHVDFWSLGVLLYGMTTGTLPFKGQTL